MRKGHCSKISSALPIEIPGSTVLGKVGFCLFYIWNDGVSTWLPVCRANFAVFLAELQGLYKPEDFFCISSNVIVIDHGDLQITFGVDYENSPEGNSGIFQKYVIVSGYGFGHI